MADERFLQTPEAYATPDQIQNAYAYARALLNSQPQQTPYVKGAWGQGIGNVMSKLAGGYEANRAAEMQQKAFGGAASAYPALGNPGAPPSSPASSPPPAAAAPVSSPGPGVSPPVGSDEDSRGAIAPSRGDDPAIAYLKQKEGFEPVAKWDYKHYSGGYGTRAERGQTFTPESARADLVKAVEPVSSFLDDNVKVPMTAGQRTALTSFGYNLGVGEGGLSDLIDDVNSGNWPKVAAHMQRYNRAGGEPSAGLAARRADEARLILAGAGQRGAVAGPILPLGEPSAFPGPGGAGTRGIGVPQTLGALGLSPTPGAMVSQPGMAVPLNAPGSAPQTLSGTLRQLGAGGPAMPGVATTGPQQAQVAAIAGGRGPQPGGAPGPSPAMIGAIAGPQGGAAPSGSADRIPPVPGLPPLPTDEGIRRAMMTGNQALAEKLYEQKRTALAPQQVTNPMTGEVYIGNPYTGYTKSGLPGMPQLQKIPYEVAGIKGEGFVRPTSGPGGAFGGFERVPIRSPGAGGPPQGGGAPAVGGEAPGGTAPGGLGPLPDTIEGQAQWGMQYGAQKKAADTVAVEQAKAGVEPISKAITKSNAAPNLIQRLDVMRDAYNQPGVSGGPFGKELLAAKGMLAQLGIHVEGLTASNVIDKLSTQLAFELTKELTSRPAAMEVLMQIKANPGLLMNNKSAIYMIGLLRQQAVQDRDLGAIASSVKNPAEWASIRDKYYADHPLISPFTGKPLNTAADYNRDFAAVRSVPEKTASPATAPVQVSSPNEARKLPSGTRIQTPDGRIGLVP